MKSHKTTGGHTILVQRVSDDSGYSAVIVDNPGLGFGSTEAESLRSLAAAMRAVADEAEEIAEREP